MAPADQTPQDRTIDETSQILRDSSDAHALGPREQLIQEVGEELSELRQAADRLDEAVALLYGLNRTDLRCLGILYRQGRVTAGELAAESGLTPGAITTAVDRLEKSGYATRVPDPQDRRRVLVVSTVAAREVGARLYGEVDVASRRILEPRTVDEILATRDYLRSAREVYTSQAAEVIAGLAGPEALGATGVSGGPAESSAPVSGAGSARLEFTKGASKVSIAADATMRELYRATFSSPTPTVVVRGNTVTIEQKRRFRPFDWRGQSAEVSLNPALPWAVSLRGGMWKLDADLRGLQLESVEVTGGASEVEIWLPAPAGMVPVRLAGGASKVTVHRPLGSAIRADVSGGASQLAFDGMRLGSLGGRNHFESPGFDEAVDRYDLRFSGGASQITIDAF